MSTSDSTCLVGGSVVTPTGLRRADVVIDGSTIVAVREAGAPRDSPGDAPGRVIDASGLVVAPGFIDLQVNGIHGRDLTSEPGSLWDVASALPRYGVTSFLPTVITAPLETYAEALAVLDAGPPEGWVGAAALGWHFEGPMLNPTRKGAHPHRHLRVPSPEVYAPWSLEAGVRMVTLAPELPGALEAVEELSRRGVVVSAGHTAATTTEVLAAQASGVRYLTHLFNAMAPFMHREPGPVGVALAGGSLACGLIVDGLHLHPITVAAAWQALGPTRTNLVTDAVGALGMPHGRYAIGGTEVVVGVDGVRTADGVLAGSTLSMDQALRNLLAFTGCTLTDALATVTTTPAALLGLKNGGVIGPGGTADLVVLTPDLDVVATIVGGRFAYGADALSWTS